LAVWYKPLAGPQFLELPAITAVEGSELSPQVPEGESLPSRREREREREREKVSLRDPLSCGGGALLEDRNHENAR
jgi:hypothetical protein